MLELEFNVDSELHQQCVSDTRSFISCINHTQHNHTQHKSRLIQDILYQCTNHSQHKFRLIQDILCQHRFVLSVICTTEDRNVLLMKFQVKFKLHHWIILVWSALCHQTVKSHEKLSYICFKLLRMAHELYKSCVFTAY